jgi:hypothetical protein
VPRAKMAAQSARTLGAPTAPRIDTSVGGGGSVGSASAALFGSSMTVKVDAATSCACAGKPVNAQAAVTLGANAACAATTSAVKRKERERRGNGKR